MKTRTLLSVLLLTLSLFLVARPVAAQQFAEIFTTDAPGSTTPKYTFGLLETPFLYLKVPSADLNFTGSFWGDPDGNSFFASGGPDTNQERWLSLPNWDTIKKQGVWDISASYLYFNGDTGSNSLAFTVTPEPISTTLFLVGGAPLAISLLRRKRSTQKV